MLEEFLGQPEVAVLMWKDFLICGIDQDEMVNGMDVASALRKGKSGGIPWFVFLDPSEPVLRRDVETGKLKRRDAAVLATADGPDGNIGCPMMLEERSHFLAGLAAARKTLNDEQLMRIAELHRKFAANRNEKYGKRISQLPKAAPTFAALKKALSAEAKANPIKIHFPKFRALAKNYLAKPEDRGQALYWCLTQFQVSGIEWKKPAKVLVGLANGLVDEWAEAAWASNLEATLESFQDWNGFDAEPLLKRLEKSRKATRAAKLSPKSQF